MLKLLFDTIVGDLAWNGSSASLARSDPLLNSHRIDVNGATHLATVRKERVLQGNRSFQELSDKDTRKLKRRPTQWYGWTIASMLGSTNLQPEYMLQK
jgi:hypothetical protein